MAKFINLTNTRFKRWLVLRQETEYTRDSRSGARWVCRCDCGNERVVHGALLRNGKSGSCGCLRTENIVKSVTKHGNAGRVTRSRTHRIWSNMKQRCLNPRNTAYSYYGGRGIKVCIRWLKFENFLADMGDAGPVMTLERENTNGDYERDNCHWATRLEQQNNIRKNVFVTHAGETMTVSQWARRLGVRRALLEWRIPRWGIERALTTPVQEIYR